MNEKLRLEIKKKLSQDCTANKNPSAAIFPGCAISAPSPNLLTQVVTEVLDVCGERILKHRCKCLVHITPRKGAAGLGEPAKWCARTLGPDVPRSSPPETKKGKEVNCPLPSLRSLTEQRKSRQKQRRVERKPLGCGGWWSISLVCVKQGLSASLERVSPFFCSQD